MDYLIGKVIGNRYEIIEKVGTGGMATKLKYEHEHHRKEEIEKY